MSFAAFGMGMLGKLATNLSDTYGTGKGLRDKQREEAHRDYIAREREGIMAKVEGAKAAGLHPLAALQGSSSNSPTAIIGGSAPPDGSTYVPAPVPAQRDDNIDRYNAARARLAEIEADKAQRDYAASTARLASQPGNAPGILPTSPSNLKGRSRYKDGVIVEPDKVIAGVGGVTAGTHPGMTRVESPGMPPVYLPSLQLAQQLEDMDLLKYFMAYKANEELVDKTIMDSNRWFRQARQIKRFWDMERAGDPATGLDVWVKSKSRLSRPKLR